MSAEPAASQRPVRVAVAGLGHAGTLVARMCLDRPDVALAGAVVTAVAKVGVDVGTLVGRAPIGIRATDRPLDVAADPAVDVVVYCGLGAPAAVAEALGTYAAHGKDVITVTGLIHPATALGPAAAAELAARAAAGGARIVGAGWNPGFLLDVLPVTWAACVPNVRHVFAERISELSGWGDGVLEHLGIGAAEADLSDLGDHLPLEESAQLIAAALALGDVAVAVTAAPTFAPAATTSGGRTVAAGAVDGFTATACATTAGGAEVVRLNWLGVFALDLATGGLTDSVRVSVEGDTTMSFTATGTTFTDSYPATAARALNVIGPLRGLPPGLYRPDQVPLSAADRF